MPDADRSPAVFLFAGVGLGILATIASLFDGVPHYVMLLGLLLPFLAWAYVSRGRKRRSIERRPIAQRPARSNGTGSK